jgi:DNA-binding transcriptional MerR regulator
LTVGQLAERFGVSVRTLHHYDEIGLLAPSGRSVADYRLYTEADVVRLQQVVVYRRLGFALKAIGLLLDDPDADVEQHLRRQRAVVKSRLDGMRALVTAIDRALENAMNDKPATEQDLKELFGDSFDDYREEAEQRTKSYTKADWAEVKAETDELHRALISAFRSGEPPTSEAAMDAAEAHREHIDRRFYACNGTAHKGLADLYVSDARYTARYDESLEAPGLAQYVHDAMYANAARHND